MIRLTSYEERMLCGEFGVAKRVALQKMIDYAQILGAKDTAISAHYQGSFVLWLYL